MRTLARVIAALLGVYQLIFGGWAYVAPRSFAAHIATFPPFNEHLIHDGGAFSIGLGVAALVGALCSDALIAVLAGTTTGSALHLIAHLTDSHLGGRASDPLVLGAIGAASLLGLLAALSARRHRPVPD